MAMTGMRRVTTGLGLVERPPPERLAREGAPRLLAAVPVERRGAVIELAHWGFGAAAGATFGAAPRRARTGPWAGPMFGLAIWAVFEVGVRRLLRLSAQRAGPQERLALAADHVLYGAVVGGRRGR